MKFTFYLKEYKPERRPEEGETRYTRKFAWLPIWMEHVDRKGSSFIWLEMYDIKEVYYRGKIRKWDWWSEPKLLI